ncbi:hypothetical protein BZG72_14235 [Salinivibrio sp. PR6]|uniref:Uncharacterized protein n=1 Tax=Salinivibrio siamensis TaxID=414286 RepID=A0ABX3K7F2_9GAMM|nr:hypothetical protein WN56_00295 [Salinivibrio sp. KP-1]OOE73051.1 hypothetical protein BZG23_12620 [Salinivibrio sp. ML290]OOE78259.1 hypothetical protein BZG25_12995 [Salinivibrio sp. ML198]OOE79122.1 hypothetical protein BZG72_14235 [Salinivibrio sp. PR6]OOE83814.1 hypothetical protein BZG73_10510 [Salinivibrio siamensis]
MVMMNESQTGFFITLVEKNRNRRTSGPVMCFVLVYAVKAVFTRKKHKKKAAICSLLNSKPI